jgi:hypothetical protein
MRLFAVTVRLEKNPAHDPKNKKTGPCPLNALTKHLCDDVTGEHHTLLHSGGDKSTVESVRALYESMGNAMETVYHVTRVEEVILP